METERCRSRNGRAMNESKSRRIKIWINYRLQKVDARK